MIDEFTFTYNPCPASLCGEFDSRPWRGALDITLCDKKRVDDTKAGCDFSVLVSFHQ